MTRAERSLDALMGELGVPVAWGAQTRVREMFIRTLKDRGPEALRSLLDRAVTLGQQILQERSEHESA